MFHYASRPMASQHTRLSSCPGVYPSKERGLPSMRRRPTQTNPQDSAAPKLTTIRRQAIGWLTRIHARESEISCFDHERYLRWLARSPRHLDEMLGLVTTRATLTGIYLADSASHPKPH